MIVTRKLQAVALLCSMIFSSVNIFAKNECIKSPFEFNLCDWRGRFSGKLSAPDAFYGNNVTLLNNNHKFDEFVYVRHTLDLNFELFTGQETYGFDVAAFKFNVRNKGVWGNRDSIASTTEVQTSTLGFTEPSHKHSIPRHIFWMREVWLQFAWNVPLGLGFSKPHYFKFGAFPFQLGRGIALGSNYATGPSVISFFDDSTTNQYAFGFQWFGDLVCDRLSYDVYLAILENKSSSTSLTKEKIFTNAFNASKLTSSNDRRGFGNVNVLLAGRLNITAWDNCHGGKFTLEPYAMYNRDPEQKLEFIGDADSKITTFGLAGELTYGWFEGGFEVAKNLGRQSVKGWDRNVIDIQNRVGALKFVNSRVLAGIDPTNPGTVTDLTPFRVAHDPNGVVGAQVQTIIQNSSQDADLNGMLIGDVSAFGAIVDAPAAVAPATVGQLFNDVNRFRDPYKNKYCGWMFVADAAAWLIEKELNIAATVGVASGDANPNQDLSNPNSSNVDGDFCGFLGLQQSYTGKRVKSAFVLGGAGRLVRPLSAPESNEVKDPFATTISEYTNLIVFGLSSTWEPTGYCHRFKLNPNILLFWEECASKKFDATTGLSSATEKADRFLGVEANLFFDVNLNEDIKFVFGMAAFVPGKHFDDIKGQPLKSGELFGNNVAFSINGNLEYRF